MVVESPQDTVAIGWKPSRLAGRPDLYQHASLAFASGVGVGVVTESPGAAVGSAMTLGIVKELLDARVDRTDLLADLIGATLAAFVTRWISR
ncbi:MAG: hypothetical protein E6K80_13920 [Candidatus Eisenbacteria bacterium]|uniref:Uncharacterized protein n=1 Tax=Eiseniibacteriota bacterium TaxID=2212470 RepID=A0A538TYK6_UNCEI|nr:MAG: hypothetical protein E6K80_13920 [Candidatus Eisenbacteria bacterium]